MIGENYALQQAIGMQGAQTLSMRNRTAKEQLQDALAGAEERVKELKEAITILNEYPHIERLLSILRTHGL